MWCKVGYEQEINQPSGKLEGRYCCWTGNRGLAFPIWYQWWACFVAGPGYMCLTFPSSRFNVCPGMYLHPYSRNVQYKSSQWHINNMQQVSPGIIMLQRIAYLFIILHRNKRRTLQMSSGNCVQKRKLGCTFGMAFWFRGGYICPLSFVKLSFERLPPHPQTLSISYESVHNPVHTCVSESESRALNGSGKRGRTLLGAIVVRSPPVVSYFTPLTAF